jgi:hypothetical protein
VSLPFTTMIASLRSHVSAAYSAFRPPLLKASMPIVTPCEVFLMVSVTLWMPWGFLSGLPLTAQAVRFHPFIISKVAIFNVLQRRETYTEVIVYAQ